MAETVPTPGSVLGMNAEVGRSVPRVPPQLVFPAPLGGAEHDRRGARFLVHGFRIVGNSAFSEAQLKRVVARFVDLELNLYDLGRAADALTEFYHDRGFTLARPSVPAQRVEDGIVTLAVIEGRVGELVFSGARSYSDEFLRARRGEIEAGALVTGARLERTLLLLNELPGLRARATLAPGTRFGESDLLIRLEESRVAGTLSADNAGRRETGGLRFVVGAELNNALGAGDQLATSLMRTDQGLLKFARLAFSRPLGTDGWRASVGYSATRYDVAGRFAGLGLGGEARSAELTASYPQTRRRGESLTYSATVRHVDLRQSTFGVETSRTQIPMLALAANASFIGKDASVTQWSAQLASNFRRDEAAAQPTGQRLRVELDGNYLLPLNRQWDLYLRGGLMFSPDKVPDSEKYSLGGPGSVRAYRASELRGDSGWQGTIELRRDLPLGGLMPAKVAAFFDGGRAIYKAPGFSDGHESLTGWGMNLTLFPSAQSTVKLEYARPSGGKYAASDGRAGRLWASLTVAF